MPEGPLILIAGGGTGGHVFPALAVARELVAGGARVEFVGTARGFEAKRVPDEGYVLHTLPVRGLAGKSLGDRVRGLLALPAAICAPGGWWRDADRRRSWGWAATPPARR